MSRTRRYDRIEPYRPPEPGQPGPGQSSSGQSASGQSASGQSTSGQPGRRQPASGQSAPGQGGAPGRSGRASRHGQRSAESTPGRASPGPRTGPEAKPRSHAKPTAEADARLAELAQLQPMDVDGVAATTIGTVIWGLAFLVLLPFRSNLDANGHGWWLWTCLAGFGLGLWGIAYCRLRRASLARTRRAHRR